VRVWDLHTLRGTALVGVASGLILASTVVARELWRRGLEPSLVAGASDRAAGPGPSVDALDAPAIADLRSRALMLPVEGVGPEQLTDSFADPRAAGSRLHRAVDILAPRGTPVRAVEDGTIERLDVSAAGGISIYQFDPAQRYCYYYAHLDRYALGLREGATVGRGQVIGYVGTTGNAPRTTPHLHFAIYRLSEEKRWSAATALNPYPVFR
jgi:murein DD-endopeptidase MepM/ murein hydrolase activator NlpD